VTAPSTVPADRPAPSRIRRLSVPPSEPPFDEDREASRPTSPPPPPPGPTVPATQGALALAVPLPLPLPLPKAIPPLAPAEGRQPGLRLVPPAVDEPAGAAIEATETEEADDTADRAALVPRILRAPTPAPAIPLETRTEPPRTSVPAPSPLVVVRAIVEVLAGVRPVAQLASLTTPRLQLDLERRACRTGQPRSSVRSVRMSEPRPGVAEVSAVIRRGKRVAALALRMELAGSRWRVTTVQVG
jgi:hypothetical protein